MAAGDVLAQLRRFNTNQLLAVTAAVIVAAASGWVGFQARKTSMALETKREALQRATEQVASVQRQLRPPTPTETAELVAEASRIGALGVADADRLVLVDSIGRLAEASGLARVRVLSRARNDSLYLRPRAVVSQTLAPAGYELNVEFAGGFAEVVKFVNSLPPSVSVSRFSAARRGGQTGYQMILSVYQLNAKEPG
jgi:hypothetical protein